MPKLDYCEMLNQDQILQGEERKAVFIQNWNEIIDFTKTNGFPNYDFNSLPKDSCKTWAIMATLIHITQTKPELILNTKILDLFEQEIDKGNLDPEDLYPAFAVPTGGGQKFCEDLKPFIEMTFQKWNMSNDFKGAFQYKKCEGTENASL